MLKCYLVLKLSSCIGYLLWFIIICIIYVVNKIYLSEIIYDILIFIGGFIMYERKDNIVKVWI